MQPLLRSSMQSIFLLNASCLVCFVKALGLAGIHNQALSELSLLLF